MSRLSLFLPRRPRLELGGETVGTYPDADVWLDLEEFTPVLAGLDRKGSALCARFSHRITGG